MVDEYNFKVGDLVRPKTASKKSRAWKVIKNVSKEETAKMVKALTGITKNIDIIEVQCESFAYNKTQVKYFNQIDLVLVQSSSNINKK